MQLNETVMVATIIQVSYPGGLQTFLENQGAFLYVPQPVSVILIKLPQGGLDKDIRNKILQSGVSVEFLTSDEFNLSHDVEVLQAAQEQVARWIDENLSPADANNAVISMTPIANIIALETVRKGSKLAIKFERFLKTIEGHGLSFVLYDGGSYSRVVGSNLQRPSVKPEAPKRETVLTDDDILNVKIALGQAETVEDFLNSI